MQGDRTAAPAHFLRQRDDLPRLPQRLIARHENPVQDLDLAGMDGGREVICATRLQRVYPNGDVGTGCAETRNGAGGALCGINRRPGRQSKLRGSTFQT